MEARTNRMVLVAGLAFGAALSVSAVAMAMEWRVADPDDLKGDFKQPLKEVRGEKIQSQTMITESDGKNTYKLSINGDDISAEINGEKVPAERIRRKDGKIEVLDANGGVVKTFSVMNGGDGITVQGFGFGEPGKANEMRREIERQMAGVRDGRLWVGDLQGKAGDGARREIRIKGDGKGGFKVENDGQGGMKWSPAEGNALAITNSNPPPVMIGITMSEPEDSVLEFLNLENAIRVDRVVEGLPGAQAGLKTGDLIVEVKGEKGISQDRLREILRASKPGDELAIKVTRKGNQTQDITLKLAAFDQSKLGITAQGGGGLAGDREVMVVRPPQTRMWDDAQKQLDDAMKALKDNPNLQPEALKKQLDEALSKASDALKSAKDQMRGGLNEMRFRLDQNGDDNVTILRGQGGDEAPRLLDVPIVPSPRMEVRGMRLDNASEKRMEAIERKLDSLNKRMDEIRELLKEKQGR